jgi:futalosine hydrolase
MANADICNMNILLAAATFNEIQPASAFMDSPEFQSDKTRCSVLITGVGGIATTYNLTRSIRDDRPDFALLAGVAGSFRSELLPGSVVCVNEELIGDLGAEESKEFRDVFDLGLITHNEFPFQEKILKNPNIHSKDAYGLMPVRSISINEITTRKERIESLLNKYNPEIESMEGAAFHYVCLQENIPFLQIRGISNYVGERNKENWNLNLAITNLNKVIIELLISLKQP